MTFDITRMCCFPLNNCSGQVVWEQSSVTASIIQTSPSMSLETLLRKQHTKVPIKPKGTACLLCWNRERWSDTLGAPLWDARAMCMCSTRLWMQYLGAHCRSETAKKHGINAVLQECRVPAQVSKASLQGMHAICSAGDSHAGNWGRRTKLKQVTAGKA